MYDDRVYIRPDHLDKYKHQIPLYHRNGESYAERMERTGKNRFGAWTVARENLVLPTATA